MKETEYQELFESYHCRGKHSGSEISEANRLRHKKRALDKLHLLVYRYPIQRFRATHDEAGEFYLYYMQKIENFFLEYDPSYNLSFMVYVFTITRRRYLNFLERMGNAKKRDNINDFYEVNSESGMVSVFDSSDSSFAAKRNEQLEEVFRCIFSRIDPVEKLLIKLYHSMPLSLSDFRCLYRFPGITEQQMAVDACAPRDPREHKETRRNCRKMIRKYRHFLVLRGQKQEKETLERKKVFQLLNLVNRRMENDTRSSEGHRKTNLLDRFFHPAQNVTMESIAFLTGTNISFVHRRLKNGKAMVSKMLRGILQESRNHLVIPENITLAPVNEKNHFTERGWQENSREPLVIKRGRKKSVTPKEPGAHKGSHNVDKKSRDTFSGMAA